MSALDVRSITGVACRAKRLVYLDVQQPVFLKQPKSVNQTLFSNTHGLQFSGKMDVSIVHVGELDSMLLGVLLVISV